MLYLISYSLSFVVYRSNLNCGLPEIDNSLLTRCIVVGEYDKRTYLFPTCVRFHMGWGVVTGVFVCVMGRLAPLSHSRYVCMHSFLVLLSATVTNFIVRSITSWQYISAGELSGKKQKLSFKCPLCLEEFKGAGDEASHRHLTAGA